MDDYTYTAGDLQYLIASSNAGSTHGIPTAMLRQLHCITDVQVYDQVIIIKLFPTNQFLVSGLK